MIFHIVKPTYDAIFFMVDPPRASLAGALAPGLQDVYLH